VLICEEVVDGMATYIESGWCFSELSTAWLGKQLDRFSSASASVSLVRRNLALQGEGEAWIQVFDAHLEVKTFFDEGDRDIVRALVKGFVLKSRLVCAIQDASPERLARVLNELKNGPWRGFLDQPVDSCLNTPLHLAVDRGFAAGVRQLLDSGANPRLRNLRGDKPVQFFLVPRFGSAATACRLHIAKTDLVEIVGSATSLLLVTERDQDSGLDGSRVVDQDMETAENLDSVHLEPVAKGGEGSVGPKTLAPACAEGSSWEPMGVEAQLEQAHPSLTACIRLSGFGALDVRLAGIVVTL